ncbi:hypothetical protein ACSX1A_11980 [Pontibacter sp. MBLB2868]|uniref:hypothetical protein n=1 Tax=Pontibacter sp. MBLB2868 TaxID=3451555 RepID=UPI003F754157
MMEDKFKPQVQYVHKPETVRVEVDPNDKEEVTTTYTYPVHSLQDDVNDSIIKVRSSVLKKIRDKIEPYKSKKTNFSDLLLSIASTLTGIAIGALYSNLKLNTYLGGFTFIVLPILAAISGTSYFFIRKENRKALNDFAEELLLEIPNPQQTVNNQK